MGEGAELGAKRIGGMELLKVLLAGALLFAFPAVAAAEGQWVYTRRCWNNDRNTLQPQLVELDATTSGVLRWNGQRANWNTFRYWLDDIAKPRDPSDPDWGVYVHVGGKMPHRPEIIAILTKGGLALRHCPLELPPLY